MARSDASTPQIFKLRRLEADDATSYRELRLEGLKRHPEAFGASWEDESARPASWFAGRLETSTVFGGWRQLWCSGSSRMPGRWSREFA